MNSKLKILAIDDNPDNLVGIKALITDSFPEAVIYTANNGMLGINLAEKHDPDVILLDIVMPDMDGFEVCRRLKLDKALCNIPVVFITALKGDIESRVKALEVGAEAFLAKPVDEVELTAQIRAMVKIKNAASRQIFEKEKLDQLILEKTVELRGANKAAMNLLEDLKNEIEERKNTEKKQRFFANILELLSSGLAWDMLIASVLKSIKEHSGFDAVGIRIKEGNDFPYYETNGFLEEFVQKEKYLCVKNNDHSLCLDENGNPKLECTCGLVISGKIDKSKPYSSSRGSFWTNQSSDLLDLKPEEEPRDNPRNRCIHEGYMSVGIIPIFADKNVIGTIQLNNFKPDSFKLQDIEFYENIASFIGIAFKRMSEEKILSASEEKYKALYEYIPLAYQSIDKDECFLDVNPVWLKSLGYEREEVIGKRFGSFLHSDYVDGYKKKFPQFMKEGRVSDVQFQLRKKDGNYIFVSFEGTAAYNEDGSFRQTYCTFKDITQIKKLLNDLEKNIDIQNATNSILNYSLNNISVPEFLSYTLKQIIEIKWLALEQKGAIFLADEDGTLNMIVQHGLSEHVVKACEKVHSGNCICGIALKTQKLVFYDKINNDHTVHYEGMQDHGHYCVPILFSGKVLGVINTYIKKGHQYSESEAAFLVSIANTVAGIIARKNAEDSLQEMLDKLEVRVKERTAELANTQDLYFTTVNSMNDWVFVIDSESKLVFINESLIAFFAENGMRGDFIGKNFTDVFVFIDDEALRNIQNVINTGEVFRDESTYTVFGKEYFTERIISPIKRDGKVVRLVITVHDYTEIKKIEDEILKNLEKEKELNMLKSRFISVVSHEFRTPLAGILTSVQLLKKYSEKWDEAKKETKYKQISDAVYHTKALLDDVSIIDKEQSSKLTFKPADTDLKLLLEQIIDENKQVFDIDINVNFNYTAQNETHYLDPGMIRHIFTNLISNAIKYSGQSKEINFSVSEKAGKHLEFIIEDYGIGIPEDDLKFMFEPFHRASNVEGIQGTGFGMSIVKRFVDLSNGTISIDSHVGKGTRVTLLLPVIQK